MNTKLIKDFVRLAHSDLTSSSLPGPDQEYASSYAKAEFHSKGKQVLRAIAKEMGLESGTYDVRSNLGGVAVSGEVALHGEHIYIQFSQSCAGLQDRFMYRACEGRKDYCGRKNHWMLWEDLYDLPRACEVFKRVAEPLFMVID
jgi:hypothetical protein